MVRMIIGRWTRKVNIMRVGGSEKDQHLFGMKSDFFYDRSFVSLSALCCNRWR